jgi:hypothetical protein
MAWRRIRMAGPARGGLNGFQESPGHFPPLRETAAPGVVPLRWKAVAQSMTALKAISCSTTLFSWLVSGGRITSLSPAVQLLTSYMLAHRSAQRRSEPCWIKQVHPKFSAVTGCSPIVSPSEARLRLLVGAIAAMPVGGALFSANRRISGLAIG